MSLSASSRKFPILKQNFFSFKSVNNKLSSGLPNYRSDLAAVIWISSLDWFKTIVNPQTLFLDFHLLFINWKAMSPKFPRWHSWIARRNKQGSQHLLKKSALNTWLIPTDVIKRCCLGSDQCPNALKDLKPSGNKNPFFY